MTQKDCLDEGIVFKHPSSSDGPNVFDLIKRCPPLDENSRYCNLLQCSHFAKTSMGAYSAGQADELLGFISGYLLPEQPDTLFVWQMAVDAKARGKSLARRLLNALLASEACQNVRFIETTITADNRASWSVFERLAEGLDAKKQTETLFEKNTHFDGHHESETLLRIGPFHVS